MEDADRARFLVRLWEVQAEAGLSGAALARLLNVDPSYIRLLKAGKRTRPSLEVIYTAARQFPELACFLLPADLPDGHTAVTTVNDKGV